MKKIIVSTSVVIVALAMIFGLPAWENEESPTAAEIAIREGVIKRKIRLWYQI